MGNVYCNDKKAAAVPKVVDRVVGWAARIAAAGPLGGHRPLAETCPASGAHAAVLDAGECSEAPTGAAARGPGSTTSTTSATRTTTGMTTTTRAQPGRTSPLLEDLDDMSQATISDLRNQVPKHFERVLWVYMDIESARLLWNSSTRRVPLKSPKKLYFAEQGPHRIDCDDIHSRWSSHWATWRSQKLSQMRRDGLAHSARTVDAVLACVPPQGNIDLRSPVPAEFWRTADVKQALRLAPPKHTVLVIGNPGAGKSHILNLLTRPGMFESGTSVGSGLTKRMQEELFDDGNYYVDTPGFDDIRLRETAAREISDALKQDGTFNIVFVVRTLGCRVLKGDVAFMRLVAQAVPAIGRAYGVIVNHLQAQELDLLSDPEKWRELQQNLETEVEGKPVVEVHYHRVPYMPQATPGSSDEYLALAKLQQALLGSEEKVREDVCTFVKDLPRVTIMAKKVNELKAETFEEEVARLTELRELDQKTLKRSRGICGALVVLLAAGIAASVWYSRQRTDQLTSQLADTNRTLVATVAREELEEAREEKKEQSLHKRIVALQNSVNGDTREIEKLTQRVEQVHQEKVRVQARIKRLNDQSAAKPLDQTTTGKKGWL